MQQDSSRNREIRAGETNIRDREIRLRGSKLVISDDRAKEIELIDPVTINVFGTFNSDAQEDKLKLVREKANFKSAKMQRITYPLYMAILIVSILAIMFGIYTWIASTGSYIFGSFIFIIVCHAIWHGCRDVTRGLRIKNADRIMTAMMQEGLCLSCAYELCGLQVDTDGCVVCPECGAAWKVQG